jgi:hypothetical protein
VDGEADPVQRLDPAEEQGDVVDLKQRRPAPPRNAAITFGSSRTVAGTPPLIFSPNSSTTSRSQTPITSRMSCSISSTVMPRSRIDRISLSSESFSGGLNPAAV